MKTLGFVLVVCTACVAALAQPNSQFQVEVSTDNGSTWRNTGAVQVQNPGDSAIVLFRSSVRYVRNDGPVTILIGSARHQPRIFGLSTADSVLPFTATTVVQPNFSNGLSAADFGRLYGATTVGAVIAHRPNDARDTIHFAENSGTDIPGRGNNNAGNRGINTAANILGAPDINTENWIPLWIWGMTLHASEDANVTRTVTASVPAEGLRINNGNRSLGWTVVRSPLTSQEARWITGIDASVEISVPAPSAAALLGLGGLVVGRRRR